MKPKVHCNAHKSLPKISKYAMKSSGWSLPDDIPCSLFLSGFLNKIFYEFLLSSMHATHPAHLILLPLITPHQKKIGKGAN
jgi:hypothetical protein